MRSLIKRHQAPHKTPYGIAQSHSQVFMQQLTMNWMRWCSQFLQASLLLVLQATSACHDIIAQDSKSRGC